MHREWETPIHGAILCYSSMEKLIVIYLSEKSFHTAYSEIVNYTGDYRLEFTNDLDFDKPFKERMKRASNYRFAAIIGDNELEQDSVTLKNMISGKQKIVKYWEIYENLIS